MNSFDSISTEISETFSELCPEYKALTPADPGYQLMNLVAYRELVLRNWMNHQISDPTKTLQKKTISPGGTLEHYRSMIESEFPGIGPLNIIRGNIPGQLNIYILESDVSIDPKAVKSYLNSSPKRILNDSFEVFIVTPKSIDISAIVWLKPNALDSDREGLKKLISKAFTNNARWGYSVNISWLYSLLHAPFVYKVELKSPTHNVEVLASEFPRLGELNLDFIEAEYVYP